MKTLFLTAFALSSSLVALAGRPVLPAWVPRAEKASTYFTPVYFRGDAQLAPEIQRVALLPMHGGAVAEAEVVASLDPVLVTALQRQMRFEVVTLSREDCQQMFGVGAISWPAFPRPALQAGHDP
jgi:hypothetical protein